MFCFIMASSEITTFLYFVSLSVTFLIPQCTRVYERYEYRRRSSRYYFCECTHVCSLLFINTPLWRDCMEAHKLMLMVLYSLDISFYLYRIYVYATARRKLSRIFSYIVADFIIWAFFKQRRTRTSEVTCRFLASCVLLAGTAISLCLCVRRKNTRIGLYFRRFFYLLVSFCGARELFNYCVYFLSKSHLHSTRGPYRTRASVVDFTF